MAKLVIREATTEEWDNAMELAFRVFLKFESKDYGKKGTEAFAQFVTDEMLKKSFIAGYYKLFIAFLDDEMVGITSIRNGNHISLLFVDGKYHKMGIGSRLIIYATEYLMKYTSHVEMTVNAAPYATEFYHKMGFVDQGIMTTTDNIIYTPMAKKLERNY